MFILFITCFSFSENININDISVRFCDENTDTLQKRVSLYSEAGKNTKECVIIINNSENNGYIDLHFVSQTTTNQGERACALPGNPDDVFVKYLKPNRSGLIYLKAKDSLTKNFEIIFPVGISGVKGGCLAFLVNNNEKNKSKGTLLSLVTRKANLFDILIDDKQDFIDTMKFVKFDRSSGRILIIWNRLKSWIRRNGKDKTVGINIGTKNLGNVSHAISFSGKLYGLLGYKKNIISEKGILRYDNIDGMTVSRTGLSLPEYQGLFWFRLNISNALHFDFNTSHIPKDKLIEKKEKYTIIFFVLSRVSIGFRTLIIFAGFLIYRIGKTRLGNNRVNLNNIIKKIIRK